jgi:hypothetical protein
VKRENDPGGALLLLARGSPSRQEFVAAIVRPEIDEADENSRSCQSHVATPVSSGENIRGNCSSQQGRDSQSNKILSGLRNC